MAFVGRILVSSGMQSILLRLMSPLRAALLPVHPCSFHSSFVWCFYRSMAIKRGTEFLRQEVSTAFMGALAHAFSSALIIGAAYSALCLLLFAIAIIRGGHNYSHNILTVFLPAMIVNAVLVISVALETVTIYRITGSAVLSGAVVIVGFVMSLTLYGAFLQAPIPSLRWIFFLPGPYLGVGCALGYSDMGQLTLLGYGVAASCLSVLIYALLSFRAGGVLNGSSD